MRLSFIQLTAFRANWKRLGMNDWDLQELEMAIARSPWSFPVVRGTGGLRKIRFSGHKSSSGKSGGVRVCYTYFADYGLIYLCAVYPKNEKDNLSERERNEYRRLLADFDEYLRKFFHEGMTP